MKDRYGRTIDYMRISVTDRCNLRCVYCMPEGIDKSSMGLTFQDTARVSMRTRELRRFVPSAAPILLDKSRICSEPQGGFEQVSMGEILTFEEILCVVRAAAAYGITRFKITGGEPLVRRGVEKLLAGMKQIPGVEQVTLTTNGILLSQYLPALLDAGLDAVNISIDTLDRAQYAKVTGKDCLAEVLGGLDAALDAGIPVKVNATVWTRETDWEAMLLLAKDRQVDVRFIELMPIGAGAAFSCVSVRKIREWILRKYPGAEDDPRPRGNGPASYIRIPGFTGSIGFISAVHGKFCSSCNRLRLTSRGLLKPCLCYGEGVDVLGILRRESGEIGPKKDGREGSVRMEELAQAVKRAIDMKPMEHCFEDPKHITEQKRMSEIGG